MMVICAFENRDRPEANDRMSDQDRIKLHKTFFAYAGTYEIEGGKVTHNIDTSWNEVWSGTSQVRQAEIKGNQLVLTTSPFRFNVDGKLSIITLSWNKYP
ncbi:lipocalin-like domain-containing protein [Methylobacterium gregans]